MGKAMARTIVVSPGTWLILWLLSLAYTSFTLAVSAVPSLAVAWVAFSYVSPHCLRAFGFLVECRHCPSFLSLFLPHVHFYWLRSFDQPTTQLTDQLTTTNQVEALGIVVFHRKVAQVRLCLCCPNEVPHLRYSANSATGIPFVT